ncbi:MAG: hypothetical protein SVK54_09275 [candidate division WOR-3 bacterium]|nr:hypothetical protein [candidate division WOR-3 bacterium]
MKKRYCILISIMIVMLTVSCSQTNPLNTLIDNVTSVFVAQKSNDAADIPSEEVRPETASMTLLAQNDAAKDNGKETEQKAEEKEDNSEAAADTVFDIKEYSYMTRRYRDPFISVLELQREGMRELEVETASYYGMIQGKNGRMALFKDATGMGYVFYEGQKVSSGVLLKIEPDSVIFKIDEYGTVRTKVIKMKTTNNKK